MVILTIAKVFDNCLTKGVKLPTDKQISNVPVMQEQRITVRQLLRNYKKFSNSKKTLIITNNGQPKAVIIPYEDWVVPPIFKKRGKNKAKKFTLEELEKYSFFSGETNLSQEIDEILYGDSNHDGNDDNS